MKKRTDAAWWLRGALHAEKRETRPKVKGTRFNVHMRSITTQYAQVDHYCPLCVNLNDPPQTVWRHLIFFFFFLITVYEILALHLKCFVKSSFIELYYLQEQISPHRLHWAN